MEQFINFLLHNNTLDCFIYFFMCLNLILITIIDWKQQSKEKGTKIHSKNDKLYVLKICLGILAIITTIIIIWIFYKYLVLTILIIFLPIILITKSLINSITSKNDNSYEKNFNNIMGSIFYLIFFSSYMIEAYLKLDIFHYSCIPMYNKKIILTIYLTIKIFLALYLIFINTIILISNINEFHKNKKKKTKRKQILINYYNFDLYMRFKNNFFLIIDSILYFLLFIPSLTINSFIKLVYIIDQKFKRLLLKIFNYISDEKKYSIICKKVTFVLLFITIIFINIFLISSNTLKDTSLKEIYSFISTVVLIPIVYDLIKTKEKD